MRVIDEKITDFLTTLNLGLEWIGDAGKKLVAMLDTNPKAFDDIMEGHAPEWLTRDVLRTIEAVGRGQIAPELLMLPLHVFNRLAVLPTEAQVKAMQEVEVVSRRTGTHRGMTHERKPACRLTKEESKRVIGPNGIRTAAEQSYILNTPNGDKSLGQFSIVVEKSGKVQIEKLTHRYAEDQTKKIRTKNGVVVVELFL